jgi:phage/conjugal plasmid C-4 type zinc finger TraR family protein
MPMATGWAREGAVQEQIDDTVKDGVLRAKAKIPSGPSASHCDECGEAIPEARRAALPGVRLCIVCQQKADADDRVFSGYNRRGSKDSQLR